MAKKTVKKSKRSKPALAVATGVRAGGMSTNHNRRVLRR
jgi:hypothetical protein